MFEWSDEDLMVRDALRAFIDKEIRPHIDELETGQLRPTTSPASCSPPSAWTR